MLDTRPDEREATSWLYVAAWSLLIFLTVPLARTLQAWVSEHLGRAIFMYGVISIILALWLVAVLILKTRKRKATLKPLLWLSACSALFIVCTVQLRGNPEEAVHFVEYGVLGVLVYRALTQRISDTGIYVAAALITTAIGICDEGLQWLTPNRVWGLSDIRLNSTAAALTLIALGMGLEPRIIAGHPRRATWQLLCRCALAVVLLLGASLLNTPQRINWYVERLPALRFIVDSSSVMAEYGYRYEDAQAGVFRSRLAPQALEQTDRLRAATAAASLDQLPALDDYREFLRLYTPFNDPFLHEARVHLNRRDYYLQSAARYQVSDDDEFRRRMTIAHYENRIMENYFPETLSRSGFLLPATTVSYMRANALHDTGYESPVSKALLTRVDEQQVRWGTLLLALTLLSAERRLAVRRRT